jgi:hypothetical protein
VFDFFFLRDLLTKGKHGNKELAHLLSKRWRFK